MAHNRKSFNYNILIIGKDVCDFVSSSNRQSIKHQALVESQVRHCDIVSSLCDDILVSFQSCLQIAEHMKVTGVQVKDVLIFFNSKIFLTVLMVRLFCVTQFFYFISHQNIYPLQ